MKKIMAVSFLLLSSLNIFAGETKVELTSFVYAGTRNVAELCGKVSGISSLKIVKIVIDGKTDRPGNYNVVVDKDGSFCTAVVSYNGTAEASIDSGKSSLIESNQR